MRGPRASGRARCRALAVLGCACVAALLVAAAAPAQRLGPGVGAVALPSAVPAAAPPHIAFTDAADDTVVEPLPEPSEPGPGPTDPPPSTPPPVISLAPGVTTHRGETSVNARGWSASVSAAEQPDGDVYLTTPPDADDPRTFRLTCDSAVETHPVVSPDGSRVAYASNASGTFRLWVAELPDEDDPSCDSTTRTQLAGAPGGENLWPGWVDDTRLVFSATGSDPLGDIWLVDVGPARSPVYDAVATRLTDDPAAETQPNHGLVKVFGNPYTADLSVIVLTTSEFRPDGSLGYIVLPRPDPSPGPTPSGPPPTLGVSSLWGDGATQQGSEGVWSPDGNQIAYTTTELDPYGDVVRANVEGAGDSGVVLGSDSVEPVAARPGRAESHPAWLSRSGGDLVWRYTVRTASGDVSDVVAADGSERRTIAGDSDDGRPLDESTPTYSPDGTRIAYSRTATASGGREVVMADADGGDVVVLDRDRPDEAVDVEPAWSPDGTRIAFVRFPPCECTVSPSEIWVADVVSRTAQRVTAEPDNTVYWDENPSWSPDGTRLVIARTVELPPDLAVSLTGPETIGFDQTVEITAQIENVGRGTANDVTLEVTGPTGGNDSDPAVVLERVDPPCRAGDGNTFLCHLEDLVVGGTVTVGFRVTGRGVGNPTIRAEVAQTGVPQETELGNNQASTTISVTTPPDIVVTAVPDTFTDLGAVVGDTETITFAVYNSGSLPAREVSLVVDWASAASSEGSVTVAPAAAEARCGADVEAPFTCDLGTIEWAAPTEVTVVVSPGTSGAVEVTGAVDQVDGEVDVSDNATTVSGSVSDSDECCSEPSSVPSALLAGASAVTGPTGSLGTVQPSVVREASGSPLDGPATTLWVIDAETGAGHELAGPGRRVCVCPEVIPGRGPAWSPDGLRVAFERQGSVLVLHLADTHGDAVALRPGTDRALVDAVTGFSDWSDDGGTPTPSRHLISVAEDPAWSPDGKQLAIAAQPAGQPDQRGIYRISPDGTGLTEVAQGRGPETEPAWQPSTDLSVRLTADPAVVLVGTSTTLTATVDNAGPARAVGATLELTVPPGLTVTTAPAPCSVTGPGVLACTLDTLAPGGSTTVALPVTGAAVGTYSARADVGSPVPDRDATNNTATATVQVTKEPPRTDVAVTVIMDPDPGYVGGTGTLRVEVSNSATGTAAGIQVTIRHPSAILRLQGSPPCFTGSPCSIGTLAPGARRTLTAPVTFRAAGTGTFSASITSDIADTAAANDRATRTVTVKQPEVRVLQTVASPGSIVMAYGSQFPPGSRVLLTWSKGLDTRRIPVDVAADGTLALTQMLLLRRDAIGERDVVATAQDPTLYTPVTTTFLVTPRTVTPPADFVSRN